MSTFSPITHSIEGIPPLKDAFVVMVKTEWNAVITDELEKGCVRTLNAAGIQHQSIMVPGAFEIPFTIQHHYNNAEKQPSAYIALGCVIKGDTPHFEYVCQAVTQGVLQLNLELEVPTIFGVLTVNNAEQANERMGGIHGHKGEEAAFTAIKMIRFSKSLH